MDMPFIVNPVKENGIKNGTNPIKNLVLSITNQIKNLVLSIIKSYRSSKKEYYKEYNKKWFQSNKESIYKRKKRIS